jgi:F-type H+-transporting ATPase subunit epsilon
MSCFEIVLQSRSEEHRASASLFIGEDESGQFGIKPRRHSLLTYLVFGLARYRLMDETWRFLALPGGALRFENNQLTISTSQYYLSDTLAGMTQLLPKVEPGQAVQEIKRSLKRLDREVLERLWRLSRNRR